MYLWAKYNTQTDIRFAMVKRNLVDLAASADWTPATGDTKVSKDGGNYANSTNNPAAVGGAGSIGWKLTLTASELSCAELNVQIVDAATKAVEDQFLTVYTYGNASAKIQADLSDVVRLGLTSLPNVAVVTATVQSDAGNSSTQIKTDLTETTNDHWKDALLLITSGTLAGQVKKVTAYNGTTKILTFNAFTGTPANGVTLLLVNK